MPMEAVISPMLTRREAAELGRVPLGALDKAIEQKVAAVSRRGGRTWLRSEDVATVVLLQKTALPLPVALKRRIRRWVRETQPYRSGHASEFAVGDALVIRWTPEMTKTVEAAESYATLRDQWIVADSEIKGGEPVIRGTRITARGLAGRLDHGDTLATLTEEYPMIPVEAFQTAYTYARAHPRRGRPSRPWRSGDEALDRRGPVPVAG
jgi:uncharacterized protein (DUF433 family)